MKPLESRGKKNRKVVVYIWKDESLKLKMFTSKEERVNTKKTRIKR